MPVLVTGAEDALGRAVVDQLRTSGGEVRAYLDATVAAETDANELRAAGCKVALGELDDEGHLEAVLAQTHTVAHCWGGPLRDADDQLAAAATVASAALGAGVRRLVWIRELATGTDNAFLATLGQIDELFGDLPIETVTLATAVRHGRHDALTQRLADGWLADSGVDLAAVHAPIGIADVARAVAVADRQRGALSELRVRMVLIGPERMTLGTFLRRLRLAASTLSDRDGAGTAQDATEPPAWLVDWLSRPAVEPPDAADAATVVARGTTRLPPPGSG